MATVALLGTCDTKLEELLFLRSEILKHDGVQVVMIDVGRHPVSHEAITIPRDDLVSRFGGPASPDTLHLPRAELIEFMSSCAARAILTLFTEGRIHSVVSAGGSGGTSLATSAMQQLPVGFPKLMVSTVASGDTGPYVAERDIAMLYSVVDIAGLNYILRDVLANAAAFIACAARGYAARHPITSSELLLSQTVNLPASRPKRVAITMFGVTTPAVDAIRRHLAAHIDKINNKTNIETLVFHATGHGGRAMEGEIRRGAIDGVIDLTTTEVCDLVAGGVMSAGPDRLRGAADAGIPCVVSLGATDMVNFGPRETVPERYTGRRLYVHNPAVTLMRVNSEEARAVGEFICGKLKASKRPELIEVWTPKGGVSLLSKAGGVFEDREADGVLFDAIREGLKGSGVKVVEDERDVNDDGFAKDITEALMRLMGLNQAEKM